MGQMLERPYIKKEGSSGGSSRLQYGCSSMQGYCIAKDLGADLRSIEEIPGIDGEFSLFGLYCSHDYASDDEEDNHNHEFSGPRLKSAEFCCSPSGGLFPRLLLHEKIRHREHQKRHLRTPPRKHPPFRLFGEDRTIANAFQECDEALLGKCREGEIGTAGGSSFVGLSVVPSSKLSCASFESTEEEKEGESSLTFHCGTNSALELTCFNVGTCKAILYDRGNIKELTRLHPMKNRSLAELARVRGAIGLIQRFEESLSPSRDLWETFASNQILTSDLSIKL